MNNIHKLLIAFTAASIAPFASATLTTLSLQSVTIYPVFGSATTSGPAATGLFWATYDEVALEAKAGLLLENNSHLELNSIFLLDPSAKGSSTLSSADPGWYEGYGIDGSKHKFQDYLGFSGATSADDYLAAAYDGSNGFAADVALEWTFEYNTLNDALIDFTNLGNLGDGRPDLIITWGDISPIEYYAQDLQMAALYNQAGGATSDWGTFELLGTNLLGNGVNQNIFNPQAAIPEPSSLLFLLTSGLVVGLIGRRRK